MKNIKHNSSIFETIQFLSFDIVLGTLAVGYMATRILSVSVNPVWWIVLPLATWVVYSLDHIIDSFKNKETSVITRHKFHYDHRKTIVLFVILISIITLFFSLLYLDTKVLASGIILSIFIGLYFTILYFFRKKKLALLQKELFIAIVYTTGIFMAPLYWYGSLPSFPIILIIINIFLLVWFEGIMISWFDFDYDNKDGHTSFTVIVGKKHTRRFLITGHMLVELSTIIALIITPVSIVFWALLITFFMNLILGMIIILPDNFSRNNYFRLIGETVFWLPALVVFA